MALKNKFDDPLQSEHHNRTLQTKFEEWRRVEFFFTFFSIFSLMLAIVEYEMALNYGGFIGKEMDGGGTIQDGRDEEGFKQC